MSYYGGKAGCGVYQAIINQMPPHRTYVEAFAGGAAILRLKRPALASIAIDADPGVRDQLMARPDLPPKTEILCMDALDYLELAPHPMKRPDSLLYCDPPYLLETRSSKRDRYNVEMTEALDHRRLLAALRRLPCMVAISGYCNPLYQLALADWRLVTYTGVTRRGPREECLWMNYPEPAALHDYRYLGKDYRERERINRKRKTWRRRLAEMPALERYAILAELEAFTLPDRNAVPDVGRPPRSGRRCGPATQNPTMTAATAAESE